MLTKKSPTEHTDPDDAPRLTEAMMRDAEYYVGNRFVRHGRPPSDIVKELVSIGLDPDVLKALRAAGPGWQTRINTMLRTSLGLDE